MIFHDDDLNLAQKVQAPHKLIMVHQHRIEPGFVQCTLAPSPSILILSPTAPCRVCCTTSPPGITLRFTPSPPAPCVPSPPLLALALHFLAHNEKKKDASSHDNGNFATEELAHFPAFSQRATFSQVCRHSHTAALTNDTTTPACYGCLDWTRHCKQCDHSSYFCLPLSWKSLQG